jgi:acyl carrier protein
MDDCNRDVIEIRDRVDRILADRHPEIWSGVRTQLAEILDVDPQSLEPTANLIRDLAITSLDFLDLTYRLESTFDIKIPRGPIQYVIQNGFDEQIEPQGRLSPRALERLRLVMPEVDPQAIAPGLKTHQLSDLYTAETFVRLVAMALSESAVSSVAR